MNSDIRLDEIVKRNPGVDGEQLKQRMRMKRTVRGGKYRFNLVRPFSGGTRHRAAEIGGPGDNIRKKQ